MAMKYRFTKDHDHVTPLATRTYPKGWEGELPDDVLQGAIAAGAVKAPPAKVGADGE